MNLRGSVTVSPLLLNLTPVAIISHMKSEKVQDIQAILFDLDGVLYIGDQMLPGAAEAVTRLKSYGHIVAGITNTTTQPIRTVAKKLSNMNIPIPVEDIYTPAALARKEVGNSQCGRHRKAVGNWKQEMH